VDHHPALCEKEVTRRFGGTNEREKTCWNGYLEQPLLAALQC
jgi:hypothetical protein